MDQEKDPPPPIGKSWGWLYFVVLLSLAFEIFLFHLFTRAFE